MNMMMKMGLLGAAAFATLNLAMERTADACTEPPPEEDECGSLQIGTTTIVAVAAVTRPTSQANCTCVNGWTGFAPGAQATDGIIVDETGVPLDSFCGEGPSTDVADVLGEAFGSNWFATANALSTLGVTGGRRAYSIVQIEDNPTGELPASLAQAQFNFVNGQLEIDREHQVVTDLPKECTVCTATSTDAVCNVLATASRYLDAPSGPSGPSGPSNLVARTTCAKTDALGLLGIAPPEGEDTDTDGGCSTSGGSAGAVVFGMIGLFAFTRRRVRS
jgi:MYXO-CTERM domain-containing protein